MKRTQFENRRAWGLALLLIAIIMLLATLLTSCTPETDNYYKAVILSWVDNTTADGEFVSRVYRLKDIENNVIVNRTFSASSLHIIYYECGDTLFLRR